MIFSRDRILTTHVGSLPRNEKLSDLLMAQEEGKDYDPKVLSSEMDKAVRHVVAAQMKAGIEIFLQNVGGEIVITWDCAHRPGFGRCRHRDCHSFLPGGHTPLVLPELCGSRAALAMRL